MGQEHSFVNYVKTKFYNELFDALEVFTTDHIENLDLRLNVVEDIDQLQLTDFDIKQVYIENQPGMMISFDILLEAQLEVSDKNKRLVDEREACFQWFILECSGDLNSRFKDFKIHSVDVYNNRKNRMKSKNKLTEYFVPIIERERLDEIANDFLEQYYPRALVTPMPINPKELAKEMNLNVYERRITEDKSIFGQIYFRDAPGEFFDESANEVIREDVKEGSIFVDPNCYFLRNLGSYNNTIVHECVHWHLHRKAFELKRLFNIDISRINCEVSGGIKGNKKESVDWMEWQANSLAPKILMPLSMFKQEAYTVINELMKENKTQDVLDVIERSIDQLATYFGVSRLAAKIRMVDAGYEVAMGAFNFIDGKYVPTHGFKKGTLERNQTFSIGAIDSGILALTDATFASVTSKGRYIYVDSHFVLNTPKYVEKDIFDNMTLTNYARHNMDECCLVFTISVRSTHGIDERYQSECVLNREEGSPYEFDIKFHQGYENSTPEKQTLYLERTVMENTEMYRQLNNDFSDCLIKLKEWRDLTYKEIADKIPMEERQIRRIFNGESKGSLQALVAICIVLYLPPEISFHLIDQSSLTLTTRETSHQWYRHVLMYFQGKSVDETRDFLKKYDVTL